MSSSASSQRVKVNAGGKVFETTHSTLQLQLHLHLHPTTTPPTEIFLDCDPHHFSSLLYTPPHHLPPPPPLLPFDAHLSSTLSPHSLITSLSPHSPLLLAHSGLLSSFHPSSLSLSSTTRTHLHHISSLLPLSPLLSALASPHFSHPGLHLYSLSPSRHLTTLLWSDPTDPRTRLSRVTSLSSSPLHLFATFECRHGENAILVVDKETLTPVSEIGRQTGNSAKSAAFNKLSWVPALGLLIGSSVKSGAFGYSGYIRMFDPRTGGVVWEEAGGGGGGGRGYDVMADVGVEAEEGMFMAKVGSRSGDVALGDLRKLGGEGERERMWVYLEDPNPGLRSAGAVTGSVVVHCYKKSVFVGRDGELEAWCVVKGGKEEVVWRRNFMDKVEDKERGVIKLIEGGGDRLFVVRDNVEGVEVWESSRSSGVKTVL